MTGRITAAYVERLNRCVLRLTSERDTARHQSREQRHQIALLLEENARLREQLGSDDQQAAQVALRTATTARGVVAMQRQNRTVDVPIIPVRFMEEAPRRLYPGDTPEMCAQRLQAATRENAPRRGRARVDA